MLLPLEVYHNPHDHTGLIVVREFLGTGLPADVIRWIIGRVVGLIFGGLTYSFHIDSLCEIDNARPRANMVG